jgi:hydroxymethylpyrimidine pyrophosphatase-like HAD family hydrolase
VDGPLTSPCRLLALDIDGTLLGSDKQISGRTLRAIAGARGAGVRLVLITGRRYPAARRVASQLGPGVPLVLHHGALVIEPDPESDHDGPARVLRCVALAREAALAAIRLGREGGADPVAHCGFRGEGRLVVAGIAADNPMLSGYVDRGHRDRVQVEDLERELPDDVVQVMFAGPLPAMLDLYPRLVAGLGAQARVERTLYPGHEMGFLDVLHPQVSKGNALEFLRERWGLAREETMAIGDNWNDREMLTVAGRGLVMGNADPALHALGLEVLPTNDEDGVAVAIERYVLGGD